MLNLLPISNRRFIIGSIFVWLGLGILLLSEQTNDEARIVKNSKQPAFGNIRMNLDDDLRLGGENAKDTMFYRIRDIGIDVENNIYVVDSGNYRVQKFDRNGRYLLTIGRQGQGPGEFERPTRIRIDDRAAKLFIFDGSRKIDVFKKNGNFVRSA